MDNGKKIINISFILIGIFFYNCLSLAMDKPYHHLPDGTFRNPEGSPIRSENVKWSYKQFNEEKRKIDMTVPKDHVIDKHLNDNVKLSNDLQNEQNRRLELEKQLEELKVDAESKVASTANWAQEQWQKQKQSNVL